MKQSKQKNKPVIAVTGPDRGGFPAWIFTALAIRRAGGKALRIRPKILPPDRHLPRFDALVIGGGADVDPDTYRELLDETDEPPPAEASLKKERGRLLSFALAPLLFLLRRCFSLRAAGIDRDRDVCEKRIFTAALERKLPILGICRGAQFINIEFGGTLYQEISGFYTEIGKVESVYAKHLIDIDTNSRLHSVIQRERCTVNCLHDQAINRLGRELVISARDRAGVVQAIEHPHYPFLLGVQWHPEYLPTIPRQQRIFRALIEECGRGGSLHTD
ncbi:MAG: gamma-glutamyl-gamma-aminobutyrate hydrolase family protein [Puniceicoccaceae bacterium]|nr:MAG: gamma-glutamyl-gamma-aminobutyrate hydrolase family protein [Puniceicoccaceae bacterium]